VAARYETFLEENPPKQEIKARHILLENEEDAKAVIEALDGGADFAELAKERSTGPSGANGGDLGFFTADMMVADFSDAAFALEPGSYSAEPVQTQFGWHVILVEETREGAQPPLDEVREQLVAELQTQAVQEMLTELRAAAGVENLRDPDGAMTQN
jgi:peptidyl-prolyl cis-trans isomerase C